MPEDPMITTARRLTDLEHQVRELKRLQRGHTLGELLGAHLLIPELRGLWPYASISSTGAARDSSMQGRAVSNAGAVTFSFDSVYTRAPYASTTGAATSYLFRADEAGLDLTGAFTLSTWFFYRVWAQTNFIGKIGAVGNYAYSLQTITGAPNHFRAFISSNGTLQTVAGGASSTPAGVANAWNHLVARYTPSTELAIFVNGEKTVNTTSIPAAIFNSSAQFQIGGASALSQYINGGFGYSWIAASAVSDAIIARLFELGRLWYPA